MASRQKGYLPFLIIPQVVEVLIALLVEVIGAHLLEKVVRSLCRARRVRESRVVVKAWLWTGRPRLRGAALAAGAVEAVVVVERQAMGHSIDDQVLIIRPDGGLGQVIETNKTYRDRGTSTRNKKKNINKIKE